MKRVAWTNVAVGVVLLVVGYSFREPGETVVLTRVDTIPYAAYRDSLKAERLSAAGWRAKLAGRMAITPTAITRTDTLVIPPDTVLQLVRVEGPTLTIAPLIRVDSLWAPELHHYQIGNCDDGWSWAAGELVCDRARFGHLSLYATLGATGAPFGATLNAALSTGAGVEWSPSYRSGWRVSMAMDATGRLGLVAVRKWNVW